MRLFLRHGVHPFREDDDRAGCAMPVLCLFDNEEVGSRTRQGAASTFLSGCSGACRRRAGLTKEEYDAACIQFHAVLRQRARDPSQSPESPTKTTP